MINNLLTHSVIRSGAIVGVSAFSITTTCFGLQQYLEGQEMLAWIVSAAIQVVLVSSCFAITDQRLHFGIRAGATLLYLIAVLISVSGSFLEFDNWLCRSDREARNTSTFYRVTLQYQSEAISTIDARIAILDKEIARLMRLRRDESEVGIASHKGSGEGPMYRTLTAVCNSLSSLKDRFETSSKNIQACLGNAVKVSLTREDSIEAIRCIAIWLARVPPDQAINEELETTYGLLARIQYGEAFTKPKLTGLYPSIPHLDVPRQRSKEELFAGSINDLRDGRHTSILALLGALIIDLLILLIAIVDAMLNRLEPSKAEAFKKPRSSLQVSGSRIDSVAKALAELKT